jgi:hypothetical protein
MANANLTKKAGTTLSGDYTFRGNVDILGKLNNGLQQQMVQQSAAAGLSTRITDSFAPPGTIWNVVTTPWASYSVPGPAAFLNGNFIIGSQNSDGKIAISTNNGVSWSLVTTPFGSYNVNGIAAGNGVLVAVGDHGEIARSTDNGNTWGSLITNNFGTNSIVCVAFGKGIFVAADASGNVSVSSNNGVTWSALTNLGSFIIRGIATDGLGNWIAITTAGASYVSVNNASSWSLGGATGLSSTGNLCVTFGSGVWIAAGWNGSSVPSIAKSSNTGTSWSVVTISTALGILQSPCFGASRIVVGSLYGDIYYSDDLGATWHTSGSPGVISIRGIAYGNQTFVTNNTAWSSWLSYGKSYQYIPSTNGLGTVSNVNFWWQREVGSNKIKIFPGKLTVGITTAVEMRVGLPIGILSDSSVITGITIAPGTWDNNGASYSGTVPVVLIESGVGYVTFGFIGSAAGLSKGNANTLFSAGQILSMTCEVSVSGWN